MTDADGYDPSLTSPHAYRDLVDTDSSDTDSVRKDSATPSSLDARSRRTSLSSVWTARTPPPRYEYPACAELPDTSPVAYDPPPPPPQSVNYSDRNIDDLEAQAEKPTHHHHHHPLPSGRRRQPLFALPRTLRVSPTTATSVLLNVAVVVVFTFVGVMAWLVHLGPAPLHLHHRLGEGGHRFELNLADTRTGAAVRPGVKVTVREGVVGGVWVEVPWGCEVGREEGGLSVWGCEKKWYEKTRDIKIIVGSGVEVRTGAGISEHTAGSQPLEGMHEEEEDANMEKEHQRVDSWTDGMPEAQRDAARDAMTYRHSEMEEVEGELRRRES